MKPDLLTLGDAAALLGLEPQYVIDQVAQGKLRCGLLVPGWYGKAWPDEKPTGKRWTGGVVEMNPFEPRLNTWSFNCEATGERYSVKGTYVSQFWYLDHASAYPLALAGAEGIDCEWLAPVDGKNAHLMRPECFPWPNFVFHVGEEQDVPRRITWSNIRFRRADLEVPATTESFPDRAERITRRCQELKDARHPSWQKQVAKEEGVHPSRIKQIRKSHEKKKSEGAAESMTISGQVRPSPNRS